MQVVLERFRAAPEIPSAGAEGVSERDQHASVKSPTLGVRMAMRETPAKKHLEAAYLAVSEGWAWYRALIQAGYARSTARKPRRLYRRSAPLRKAVEEMREAIGRPLVPAPQRRRRYDRRSLVGIIESYPVNPSERDVKALEKLRQSTATERCQACGKTVKAGRLWTVGAHRVCDNCAGRF